MNEIFNDNLKVYSDSKVIHSYLQTNNLQIPERQILSFLKDHVREGDRILDIGIGTGRTLPFLKELSRNYVGIDYAEPMIRAALIRFPSEDLRVCDVRNLERFTDSEFDLVFFSFNGLDYISHEGRLIALKEIRRVLKPRGYFVFSTHNREYSEFNKFKFSFSGNPLRSAWHLFHSVRHRLRNSRRSIYTDTYAVISDAGHQYRLMTYYISPVQQLRQLESAGFNISGLRIYDRNGELVTKSTTSAWLHYLVPGISNG